MVYLKDTVAQAEVWVSNLYKVHMEQEKLL